MGEIATAKQTGQGGTSFEDQVSAYFMACMLSETPPFRHEFGLITRIDFQTRPDGWLFDDVLLTLYGTAKGKRIAVSIKSSPQFNTKGCPAEMNILLWQQFLKENSAVFDNTSDYLCLVEPPLSPSLSSSLNSVLNQARNQDADILHRRMTVEGYNSEAKRRIYRSFYCPQTLVQKFAVTEDQTGKMLSRFIHYEMDLEAVNSRTEQTTIGLCRDILKSKQIHDAVRLFNKLAHLPRELAPVSGFLTIQKLVENLRNEFELADFPSQVKDWEKLAAHTVQKLENILDRIGGTVKLPRLEVQSEIQDLFLDRNVCFLTGISGVGKTVVARELASNWKEKYKVIWLDSSDFDSPSIELSLRLQSDLKYIIQDTVTSPSYLVIDGPEKIFDQGKQHHLVSVIKSAIKSSFAPWKLLLVTPTDSFDSLLHILHRHNVQLGNFGESRVETLNDEEVGSLTNAFPALAPILLDAKRRVILSNLKLLDKVLYLLPKITGADNPFLGESHFVDLVWREEIENTPNGFQKNQFLKLLAEKQADSLSISVSSSELSIADAAPVDRLISERVLTVKNERVYFSHDLYGDWARYRLLVANSETLPQFIKSKPLVSPLWGRAIRLLAVSLLEKNATGLSWQTAFGHYGGKTQEDIIIQDLFLEALFSSFNSFDFLNSNSNTLFADDGFYLKRLLQLFLIRATFVNTEILKLANEVGLSQEHAMDVDRIPDYGLWFDVLEFLHKHADEVIRLDFVGASKIVHTWLKSTTVKQPLRREASGIAVKLSKAVLETGRYWDEKITKPLAEALLLGFPEKPDEVGAACLHLCKRVKPPDRETKEGDKEPQNVEAPVRVMDHLPFKKRAPKQWEEGPYERVSSALQEACLETQSLIPIIVNQPTLATEILLAVLIDEPADRYLGSNTHSYHYSLHEPLRWYPPFYLRGPFIHFLRISPFEAIRFVCKLTDFATDRWADEYKGTGQATPGYTVLHDEVSKIYRGDSVVFCWHKDVGNAPHSLVSVLMAFEQFFYEKLEKGEDIEAYIRHAVANTTSLAVIGPLLVVAKGDARLYETVLKDFLSFQDFYSWDLHSRHHDSFGFWNDLPKPWQPQVERWKEKRTQALPLKDAVLNRFLVSDILQKIFEPITIAWQTKLTALEESGYLDAYLLQMVNQFNTANFRFVKTTSGIEVSYVEPKEVEEKLKSGRQASLETLELGGFAFSCAMVLEKAQVISLAEAENYWSRISLFLSRLQPDERDEDESDENFMTWASPFTNIVAGMAVLVSHKEVWKALHPEYYSFIRDFSVGLIEKQTKRQNAFPAHGTDHDWNVFLACIAAQLWKDDIADVGVRKLVAGVCLLFNDGTVKKLFEQLGKLFQWDSSHFVQVQNLLLYDCAKRYRLSRRHTNEEDRGLLKLRNAALNRFCEGTVLATPLHWATIRAKEELKPKTRRRWKVTDSDDYARWPGIYTPPLKEMLKALPELHAVTSNEEQAHILFLWEQSFEQVIYELGEIHESSAEIDEFPDDFKLFIAQAILRLLLQLDSDEQREKFWKPLFSFGYIAKKLIDQYCTFFFLLNIEKTERHETMVNVLQSMLNFTNAASTWHLKHIHRHEDFRLCVLGMQPRLANIWNDDLSLFFQSAGKIYVAWFKKNQLNHHAVNALLDFSLTKSGDFIFADAILIFKQFFGLGEFISQMEVPEGLVRVGHPQHDQKLAVALSQLWSRHQSQIKQNDPVFAAFKYLVQYSVALNNPVAIELQAIMIAE